jgi:hypothetical protein
MVRFTFLIFFLFIIDFWATGIARGQTDAVCSGASLENQSNCRLNLSVDPIPAGLGGSIIDIPGCNSALIFAFSASYSYDERRCSIINGPENSTMTVIADALDFLPKYYKSKAEEWDFHGTLYCDSLSKTLILAYRGSVPLTAFASVNGIEDWYNTNVMQHLGIQPLQYQVAADVAEIVKRNLISGALDGRCGSGRSRLVLTGHSKGGAEAQFAAAQNRLTAIVFNSDVVNPVAFNDWILSPNAPEIFNWARAVGRSIQSVIGCSNNVQTSTNANELNYFYNSGDVRDIRLVSDPIAKYFLPYCHVPHAPIEWLSDTLTCSANDGHSILNLIRELRECSVSRHPGK